MSQVVALRRVFQLHLQLEHVQPLIWRRLLVDSRISLPELHNAIQAVMGWYDSHLHEFFQGRLRFSVPDPEFDAEVQDERHVRLDQLLKKPQDTLHYVYDFGDDWLHLLTLEAILPWQPNQVLPLCTQGARACPPEDCGGPPGYAELLEVMANPQHPEYDDMIDMLGDEFSPEDFDLEFANEGLANS